MIRAKERMFSHLETRIVAVPKGRGVLGSQWTMREIFASLAAKDLPFEVRKDTDGRQYELYDAREQNGFGIFLFGYTDTATSDPMIRHTVKLTNRSVPTEDEEGLTYSAHLAISLEMAGDHYPTYFEHARVARSVAFKGLNEILKQSVELHCLNPKKKDGAHIRPELVQCGEMSAALREALDRGTLHGVEFVRPIDSSGAVTERFVEKTESLRFKLVRDKKKHWTKGQYDEVLDLIGVARDKQYQKVKVAFTDPATEKKSSVDISVHDGVEDATFLRHTLERFTTKLEMGPTKIVTEIADRMCNIPA